jgi:hypothetical protein
MGGFLSPPPFEDLWVSFFLGWTVEVTLHGVVLLGVLAGGWVLFSQDTLPCCLYNSVALCNVFASQWAEAGLLSTLSLSWVRCLWIKEVLKKTPSKCSPKMSLGSNPFSLSSYVRFNFLKWTTNSSIFLMFLHTKSPTFDNRGMKLFFFLVMEKMQPVVVFPFYFCNKHFVCDVAWKEGRIFLRAKDHEDTVIFLFLKCSLLVQKLACMARHPRSILA